MQKKALDKNVLNKTLDYSLLGVEGDPASYIRSMRDIGFDVRTHNTNVTIPPDHFKICYPFTLPSNLKSYVVWKES